MTPEQTRQLISLTPGAVLCAWNIGFCLLRLSAWRAAEKLKRRRAALAAQGYVRLTEKQLIGTRLVDLAGFLPLKLRGDCVLYLQQPPYEEVWFKSPFPGIGFDLVDRLHLRLMQERSITYLQPEAALGWRDHARPAWNDLLRMPQAEAEARLALLGLEDAR